MTSPALRRAAPLDPQRSSLSPHTLRAFTLRELLVVIAVSVAIAPACNAQSAAPPLLRPTSPAPNGWFRVHGEGGTNQMFALQGSSDLREWHTIAVLHEAPFDFADREIQVATLASSDSAVVDGWGLGPLRFIPSAEINAAYANGRLRPTDILLTDALPAEVPFLAGILSLTPATPNSHVVLLAQSHAIPLAPVTDTNEVARLRQLDGREVYLSVYTFPTVIDVEGRIDPVSRAEILARKTPPVARITPKASIGAISAPTDGLHPSDIRFFGGKAANYGLLRRTIPGNAPSAIAFSIDLWDAFTDQTLASGKSLRVEIADRLGRHTNYPPDIAAVKTDLAAVRDLITKTARFSLEQRQAVISALGVFDAQQNIRFRSSSNAEDDATFCAAGLYDSFSGCLADDLDGDDTGPSHCDPTEKNERGVFRAIQKVYASFYNDNAFLERLRHRIDESQIGMGVLVHHSSPDEIELANGVATVDFSIVQGPNGTTWTNLFISLVTQKGAVSVTNPDRDAVAEGVKFYSQPPWNVPPPANLVHGLGGDSFPCWCQGLAFH